MKIEYTKAELLGVYPIRIQGLIPGFVMLLRGEEWDGKILPIYIGSAEAMSISWALRGVKPERPMTHDLLVSILGTLGIDVEKVTIDAMIGNIYTATIVLKKDENEKTSRFYIDARPSDSVAIAVRTGAPIFLANILEKYAREEEELLPPEEKSRENDIFK